MKRLNKKGFTLVELLAAIVILTVLMLVGAQAVVGIMRNSKANSLLSSLDMAAKQANTKLADGGLVTFNDELSNGSDLTDVLNYNKKDYIISAGLDIRSNYLITLLEVPNSGSSFHTVDCGHGKLTERDGEGLDLTNLTDSDVGYYCVKGDTVTLAKIEKVAN